MKVALVNHGCAKNLVDSELMLGLLSEKGHEITLDENDADIVIVNTCSFIHDAEKESVQSILQMVNGGKKVIVTGCLPQKHKAELKKAIPEISAMLGTSDFSEIVETVEKIAGTKTDEYIEKISEKPEYIYPEEIERQQITMGASSYIKIADGCNYHCGYCIIPQLRGAYHSRTIENTRDIVFCNYAMNRRLSLGKITRLKQSSAVILTIDSNGFPGMFQYWMANDNQALYKSAGVEKVARNSHNRFTQFLYADGHTGSAYLPVRGEVEIERSPLYNINFSFP